VSNFHHEMARQALICKRFPGVADRRGGSGTISCHFCLRVHISACFVSFISIAFEKNGIFSQRPDSRDEAVAAF